MTDERIRTVEAAAILGVETHRAALSIIKSAGIPITYELEFDRFRRATVSKAAVVQLSEDRRRRGVRRGRPSRSNEVVAS